MPDPTKQTISATEVAALYNVSPYVTRWMLYRKFAEGLELDTAPNERMTWGTLFQPVILREVAQQKGLEVIPNADNNYVRRGRLGCTRDATIICPDRGPGALEVKCVFDYETWMTTWRGGKHVPRHNELQLQAQMFVGDDQSQFAWGMIAVWCCARMYFFERAPVLSLWNRMPRDADEFFRIVAEKAEPDPFGSAVEAPFVAAAYPLTVGVVLDLSDDPDHVATSEDVAMYQKFKETASGADRVAEAKRLKLLALAKNAQFVKLPCGVSYRIQKSGKGLSIVPYVPDTPSPPPPPKGLSVLAAG